MPPSPIELELDQLPSGTQDLLARFHFNRERLVSFASELAQGITRDNFVKGALTAPSVGDLHELPATGSAEYEALAARGRAALEAGQVALAVLAGGMATRMGGVVKALVEAVPGKTFLELRLSEIEANRQKYGKAPPLWLMASSATVEPLKAALGARADGENVAVFTQCVSLRLTQQGALFRDSAGNVSDHASGHGDFVESLQQSGLIRKFTQRGGKVVMLTNLDNLGGTLDPALIGWHLAHGQAVTAEVVDKLPSDRGGIPVYVDGTLAILEEFRIPQSFDPNSVRVFATNVFHFDAPRLAELDMPWSFFLVNKKVENLPVVQFERLINEVTSFLSTRYLRVPRTGVESRFLPVKDNDELASRVNENLAVARARGML
ncbi:MAG: UTP--glucose-1-phosphate uridylyltransferase [Polyangiaceae bacterium]